MYKVGDQIVLIPPEPPVGTKLLVVDGGGRFRIRHDPRGWNLTGKQARRRNFTWDVVVSAFLLRATSVEIIEMKEPS